MREIANSRRRRAPTAGARDRGAIAIEFVLVLMTSLLLLFMPAAEFMRLSLFDQALAAATHQAARAAAADPDNADPEKCRQAVENAFNAHGLARWLLDQDGDGEVKVALADAWPSGANDVHVSLMADEDLYDGDEWEIATGCGASGSWIRLETRIVVQPWSGFLRQVVWQDGVRRQRQSWARNQA